MDERGDSHCLRRVWGEGMREPLHCFSADPLSLESIPQSYDLFKTFPLEILKWDMEAGWTGEQESWVTVQLL